MDSREGEGVPGEESGEGEALVAPNGAGRRRWLWLPEAGKKTSPGRLAATGKRGGEEAPGEESGEGEALVAPEWSGQWRRLRLPEVGKKTSPGRLAATGELVEHAEAA